MLTSVLISLAMVPIVISAQQIVQAEKPRPVRYRDLYRNSPIGVVAVTVSGFISAILFSMGPVYARLSGFDTAGVAGFMAFTILAGVVTQYPIGRLSDRMDRRTVIASVCALATLVAAAIVFFGAMRHALLLTLAAVFSGLVLTLYSQAVSHVNDKLAPAEMVAASSSLLLLNGIGAAFGPLLAGTLIGKWGPQAYFAILATFTGALTVFDLWRKLQRRPPATKRPYVPAQAECTGAGMAAEQPRKRA
jgi:MFS family permease